MWECFVIHWESIDLHGCSTLLVSLVEVILLNHSSLVIAQATLSTFQQEVAY